MNNQPIIKYLSSSKGLINAFVAVILKQQREDAEITDLYNRGYFTPNEYNAYMARHSSYQYMINLFSSRMNDMYYFNYVEQKYLEGYLTNTDFETYEFFFEGFYYIGDISYNDYIQALETTLQIINYNILHPDDIGGDDSGGGGGGGGDDYPEEPEE